MNDNITLYRKYRPNTFEEVYGQEHIIRAIKNSIENNKLAHAYIFNGTRGIGKTTIARIIAKAVNCKNLNIYNPCNKCENCLEITNGIFQDVIEIDAASNRGIDEIRNLKEQSAYLPVKGKKKVCIIDEVHMLTKEAFNALLKILEEPPQHIIFILATTEVDKIPDTVISRCQRYDFKNITEKEIIDMLKEVSKKENVKIDEESLSLIYQKSEGSARDAFSIYEQVISSFNNEEITLEKTENSLGIVSKIVHNNFLKLIKEESKEKIVELIDNLWESGIQIEQFLKDFCKFVKTSDLKIEDKINYINIILNNLNIFKNEEDKRLISFIILDKLFQNNQNIIFNQENNFITENKKNLSDKINWEDFIKFLEENGNLRYYTLLLGTSIDIKKNKIYVHFNNSNNQKLFNNKNTINFLEKMIYERYGENYFLVSNEIKDQEDIEREYVKFEIKKIFDAVEK